MEQLRVHLAEGAGHELQHLGRLTFTACDVSVPPYQLMPATFVVDDTLSLTTMVMAYPREAGSSVQVFSFADTQPDILASVSRTHDPTSPRWPY
jgi:hypothetical protein